MPLTTLTVRPAYTSDLHHLGLDHLRDMPGFSLPMLRLGVVNDRIVCRAFVGEYLLRYGRADLRVAGIGGVRTERRYRNRGFGRALMRDVVTYAREQGAHLALVNDTTGGYFARFGFSPVWPHYAMRFASTDAAQLPHPLRCRPPTDVDVPAMVRLYARHWDGRATFDRDPETWFWRARRGDRHTCVAVDSGGQIQGYLAGTSPAASDVEVVADTSDAASTLLAEAGKAGIAAGHYDVRWPLPPDDALASYARELLDVTLSADYAVSGGWMARVIDMRGLLDAMLPEVVAQAGAMLPNFKASSLVFQHDSEHVWLGLSDEPDSEVALGYRDFTQVMFGSLSPDTLGKRDRLPPEAVQMLRALFPPRVAALAPWDWF